jgi:hypothetical protein
MSRAIPARPSKPPLQNALDFITGDHHGPAKANLLDLANLDGTVNRPVALTRFLAQLPNAVKFLFVCLLRLHCSRLQSVIFQKLLDITESWCNSQPMQSHYALTGVIHYYRTPPEHAQFIKFDVNSTNLLAWNRGDMIAVGKAGPIEGPFNFAKWKDAPHVALANLRTEEAAAVRFTRTYGVLSKDFRGVPMSLPVSEVYRYRDRLRRAWEDDDAFLDFLNEPENPKAILWVRRTAMEIVIEDLWTLIRVLFSRDRWDDRTRKCKSPDCPAPYFLAVRQGQKFCSQRCAVLVNVRRFREREAKMSSGKRNQRAPRSKHAKAKKA